MTKSLTALGTMLCCTLLTAAPVAAKPAQPPPPPNGCNFLNVVVTSFGAATVPMPNGVSCNHGYFISATPTVGNPLTIQVEQSSVYGPDCTITVLSGGNTYVIHVQQNFCALEAGKVEANIVTGDATIAGTASGSYGSSTPGQVAVTLSQPSSPSPPKRN